MFVKVFNTGKQTGSNMHWIHNIKLLSRYVLLVQEHRFHDHLYSFDDCYINFMHAHNNLAKLYTQESIASILMVDCSCCWCSLSLCFREARFCSMLTWAYVAFGSGAGSSSDAVESGPLAVEGAASVLGFWVTPFRSGSLIVWIKLNVR